MKKKYNVDKIKRLIKSSNVGYDKLAEILKLSKQTIYFKLNGVLKINDKELKIIADMLNVKVSTLYFTKAELSQLPPRLVKTNEIVRLLNANNNYKEIRDLLKLSSAELLKRLNGYNDWTASELKLISEYYNIELSYFFKERGKK